MFKRLFLIMMLVSFFAVVGCAGEAEARGSKNPCESFLGPLLNECVEFPVVVHPSPDKRRTELGVGVDLVVYEGLLSDISYKITGEYKFDLSNGEHQAYAVVTIKLMEIINKVRLITGL
ncbi:unnamed protein product [marine sediment metagenome]|uniref:Lipoprotein n=1 Tax=marine sediment metagenome TaxID=412755 RepID=X0V8R4_9ZZZZ